jgi:hypothetical protein
MRWATMAILLIVLLTAAVWAGEYAEFHSINEFFAKQEIVAAKYLADNTEPIEEEIPLMGDIYSFKAKSPKKAFFYSLIVPGAGEYYAGSKIKPAVFLGLEAILWTGYAVYHKKGSNAKDDYIKFADDHYQWWVFRSWWLNAPTSVTDDYSHRMPWDSTYNRPEFNHEYYENIGKYSEFQVGWDDIGPSVDPPGFPNGKDSLSYNRNRYLNMRRESNDYYQNASTMVMLALANHIISAFDAALTAKGYNKGQKGFSMMLKTRKLTTTEVPFLTFDYKF